MGKSLRFCGSARESRSLLYGFIILILLFPCLSLGAWDFGLILDQTAGFGNTGSFGKTAGNDFEYSGNLIPRISGLIGDNADFYVSAGIEMVYREDLTFTPELLRTELTLDFGNSIFKAGRMYHSDPLGFIANGLFDGARVSLYSRTGTYSAGAWYTGLIYKSRANIAMTPEELISFLAPVDYGDFADTYFAPKRLLSALSWEHLSLGGVAHTQLALLGQFALSGNDKLHSQYLAGKTTIPANAFSFDLGACLELIEDDSKDMETAFAAEAGISYIPPSRLRNKVSLLGRYASGGSDGKMAAFLPLTTLDQGNILNAKLSGISMISLDYIARLQETFSLGLTSSYFIRNDLGTYYAYPLSDQKNDGYLLGNEFYARLIWSPFSDLQFNLGGGVFLPSMGDAAPKADNAWRVELNVILSLY